jgi:PKD repeat protein
LKNGLENIDELFKQRFDGFEADVDPNVWSNIQNSIVSSSGVDSVQKIDPLTTTGGVGKPLALKIIVGIVLLGAIATSTYFISTLVNDNTIETVEGKITPTVKKINQIVEKQSNTPLKASTITVLANKVEESLVTKQNTTETNKNAKKKTHTTYSDNVVNQSKRSVNLPKALAMKIPIIKKPTPKTNKPTKTEEPALQVSIKTNVIIGKAPLNVAFNVDSEANIKNYLWDFGDGSEISDYPDPTHIFNIPGIYYVSLTVIDANKRAITIPYQITVEKSSDSFINKASILRSFSPNGDGVNDVLKINGKKIKNFQAIIFNINGGAKVFEWTSIDGFWDGRNMSGELVPKGTYMLKVTSIGMDGDPLPTIQQSITVY